MMHGSMDTNCKFGSNIIQEQTISFKYIGIWYINDIFSVNVFL